MNRRSFLQFLGLAPLAPTVLAAMPETPAIKLAFPHPWVSPDTLPIGEFAQQEIERITGLDGLPCTSFHGVNVELYGRGPMLDGLPDFRDWDDAMREIIENFDDEPDRISPALPA